MGSRRIVRHDKGYGICMCTTRTFPTENRLAKHQKTNDLSCKKNNPAKGRGNRPNEVAIFEHLRLKTPHRGSIFKRLLSGYQKEIKNALLYRVVNFPH